jgi:superfamily II DNA/RNA helicase
VFGVDFFRLPRFRPRFCLQHEPIIAHDRQNWLNGMQKKVVSVASNQQRAVLVVCENIELANSIYDRLKADASIQVVKYVSSFDEAFKEKQHQEVLPGQVIIATNLAGRGTDLKPSKELLNNGGLHVIIGFLPPNSRVEAQAEGRTARSGQPGSYQFVIENTDEENRKSHLSGDPYGRILQLKSKRDEDERLRLDNIRREALPKIQLEEKLFHEYHEMRPPLEPKISRIISVIQHSFQLGAFTAKFQNDYEKLFQQSLGALARRKYRLHRESPSRSGTHRQTER